MLSLRLWPLLVAWLLIIFAFLLMPCPLAGQPAFAPLDLAPHFNGDGAAEHLARTTTTPVTLTAEPPAPRISSAPTTTATRSGLHAGPGHDCDRCADTANLPPWRRRMAEKAAAARNQYETGM